VKSAVMRFLFIFVKLTIESRNIEYIASIGSAPSISNRLADGKNRKKIQNTKNVISHLLFVLLKC
jgi:hypothetical protein